MKKVVIFGNSGSGKTTLAKSLSAAESSAHLDLDTIAWQPVSPPTRVPLEESKREIDIFLDSNESWVVEGCYTDLLELVAGQANEMIFLNLPIKACIENAKKRPWEPHKYDSKEAQDANLVMLIDWIAQYATRDDSFSQRAHQALFDRFNGDKTMWTMNVNLPATGII